MKVAYYPDFRKEKLMDIHTIISMGRQTGCWLFYIPEGRPCHQGSGRLEYSPLQHDGLRETEGNYSAYAGRAGSRRSCLREGTWI